MKNCKFCKASLMHVGELEPGMLLKEATIHRYSGFGIFLVCMLFGVVISIPLWSSNGIIAAIIVAIFGGIGAYFWQKPVDLYRCTNCGAEFYGKSLSIYKR